MIQRLRPDMKDWLGTLVSSTGYKILYFPTQLNHTGNTTHSNSKYENIVNFIVIINIIITDCVFSFEP